MGPRGVVSSVGEFNINETGRDRVLQTGILYVVTEERAGGIKIFYVESCVFYHSHHNWCRDQDRQLTGGGNPEETEL